MEVEYMKNIGEYIKKFKTYNRWFIENFYKVGLSDKEEADYLNEVFKENGIDLVLKASTIRSYRKSKDENGEYIHPELANLKFKRGRKKSNSNTPKEEIKEVAKEVITAEPKEEKKEVMINNNINKAFTPKVSKEIEEMTEEVDDDVFEEIFNDRIPKEEYPSVTVFQERVLTDSDRMKEEEITPTVVNVEESTPNNEDKNLTVMEINQNGIIQEIKNHNGLIKFENNVNFERALQRLKQSLGGDIMTVIDKYDIDCMELSIKEKHNY